VVGVPFYMTHEHLSIIFFPQGLAVRGSQLVRSYLPLAAPLSLQCSVS